MLRLQNKYKKEVIPVMMKKFGYRNSIAVPRVEKVVLNTGIGRILSSATGQQREKILENVSRDLNLISGQKPVITKAKKSISEFKLRQGAPIGMVVILRRSKMYDFLERLIYIALPCSRDFRGIDPKSIDQKGNLTLGIKEHIIFPEISLEDIKQIFGLEITVVTTAKTKEEGLELLRLLGFPLKMPNAK